MRRILPVVALCITAAGLSTSAAAAKPKPKPLTYKTGTYSAKIGPGTTLISTKFSFTLKRASCAAAAGQAKSSLHLCVSVPVSPSAACTVPVNLETPIGSFVAPVQLPTSGKLTEQAPITPVASFPGSPPTTGQSAFSVAFTKKGTATGYLELNAQIAFGSQTTPCSSGKVPFTAKLG